MLGLHLVLVNYTDSLQLILNKINKIGETKYNNQCSAVAKYTPWLVQN